MPSNIILALIGLTSIFVLNYVITPFKGSSLPLPPGPKGLPLIGNVLQLPKSHTFLLWQRWSKIYGPFFRLNVLGMNIVVLNTYESAQELLAKCGAKYSDRPRLVLAGELACKGMQLLLLQYNAKFKLHQKMLTPLLNPRAATSYQPLADIESRQLLFNILSEASDPSVPGVNFSHHLERCVSSMTHALMFGQRLLTGNEPEILQGQEIQKDFATMLVGPNLVDIFPWLNRLPLPWPWKKRAEQHYRSHTAFVTSNVRQAVERPGWNVAKEASKSAEAGQMTDEELAFGLGDLADAALDTTAVSTDWFVVAWVTQEARCHFVARARTELDEVVGRDRLPGFADRQELPWVDAIVEEVLRWRPIAPTGMPHVVNVEDEYQGCRIPAGSLVSANLWAIGREPAVFGEDADDFRPERWIVTQENVKEAKLKSEDASPLRNLPSIGFGFGRRMCPGRHIARNAMWIQIARLLWAFDIEGAVSQETGVEFEVDPSPLKAIDSLVIRPLPFNVVFKPRGSWVEKVVRDTCDTLGEDFGSLLDKIGVDRAARQSARAEALVDE